MKLPVGIISTAILSLILGVAAPLYAQEPHEDQKDQQEQKDKPAKPEENKAEAAKPKQEEKTAQTEKNTKTEEKTTQQHETQAKAEPAQRNRIPDDKFRANFGREHTFRVSEGDYRNHRFAYGGYSFGFVGVWPSNWLYTQDVFVVEIGGVYYLCNPTYPGVNLALSFTL
jgi:hypothetical protein